ncbi:MULTISPECIES: hypothetical protein [Aeromonas]|uniref:Uncharacterized protein n=1 Tax=Aeromonas caviae TaxID=648 RepID=A0AAJ6CR19_AERCA|nr:hypothetical protein [Aeromonas caviae]RWT73698.1 hypothetical protein DN604_16545 [Aeromonas caviae]WFG00224.1 hypothetical protein P5S46_22275 [Aeromonas caviae]WVM47847.1 hypothetical protein V0242_24920 [Aeromonas hydrophila]
MGDLFDDLQREVKQAEREAALDKADQEHLDSVGFDLNRWMTAFKSLLPIIQAAIRHGNVQSLSYEKDINMAVANYVKASVKLMNALLNDLEGAGVDTESWMNRWSVRKLFAASCALTDIYLSRHNVLDSDSLVRFGCSVMSIATRSASTTLVGEDKRNQAFLSSLANTFHGYPEIMAMIEEEDQWGKPSIEYQLFTSETEALMRLIPVAMESPLGMTMDQCISMSLELIQVGVSHILENTILQNQVSVPEDQFRMFMMSAFDKSSRILASVWQSTSEKIVRQQGHDAARNISAELGAEEVTDMYHTTLAAYLAACGRCKDMIERLTQSTIISIQKTPS